MSTTLSQRILGCLVPIFGLLLVGCTDSTTSKPNAEDIAVTDVGDPDTTNPDTTSPDTGAPDTTSLDTGTPDTTGPDTTSPDTTSPDTTTTDTTTTDSGSDAGAPVDAGPSPMPKCAKGLGKGKTYTDLAYAQTHPNQKLDLYLPKETGPSPLLIYIHGGGWKAGSKSGVPMDVLAFVKRGYAVASIGYRLSTEPWPATVVDVKLAVRWLRSNANKYGLDVNAFGAWGLSAGGHLVAMLAVSDGADVFDGGTKPKISAALQAAVVYYGPSDLATMDADAAANNCPKNSLCHSCAGSPETLLLDCPSNLASCKSKVVAEGSPVTYVDAKDAPMFVVHGSEDCTVPPLQGKKLHDAMTKAGAKSYFKLVKGGGHNFKQVTTPQVLANAYKFLDGELRGCKPQDLPAADVDSCQQQHCAATKSACASVSGCSAVELCFRKCMYPKGTKSKCVPECTKGMSPQSAVWKAHYALFQCAHAKGCYALPTK